MNTDKYRPNNNIIETKVSKKVFFSTNNIFLLSFIIITLLGTLVLSFLNDIYFNRKSETIINKLLEYWIWLYDLNFGQLPRKVAEKTLKIFKIFGVNTKGVLLYIMFNTILLFFLLLIGSVIYTGIENSSLIYNLMIFIMLFFLMLFFVKKNLLFKVIFNLLLLFSVLFIFFVLWSFFTNTELEYSYSLKIRTIIGLVTVAIITDSLTFIFSYIILKKIKYTKNIIYIIGLVFLDIVIAFVLSLLNMFLLLTIVGGLTKVLNLTWYGIINFIYINGKKTFILFLYMGSSFLPTFLYMTMYIFLLFLKIVYNLIMWILENITHHKTNLNVGKILGILILVILCVTLTILFLLIEVTAW